MRQSPGGRRIDSSRFGAATFARELGIRIEDDAAYVHAFAALAEQLQEELPRFKTLIVDDASGAIPGYFLDRLMTYRGIAHAVRHIPLGHNSGRGKLAVIERVAEELDESVLIPPLLIATEMIGTGRSMKPLHDFLSERGVSHTIATLSADPQLLVRLIRESVLPHIVVGDNAAMVGRKHFHHRPEVSGAHTTKGSAFALKSDRVDWGLASAYRQSADELAYLIAQRMK